MKSWRVLALFSCAPRATIKPMGESREDVLGHLRCLKRRRPDPPIGAGRVSRMASLLEPEARDPDGLFARARAGDQAAWEELFRMCYPKVVRVVRRKLD